jgi:hypothetical protein
MIPAFANALLLMRYFETLINSEGSFHQIAKSWGPHRFFIGKEGTIWPVCT